MRRLTITAQPSRTTLVGTGLTDLQKFAPPVPPALVDDAVNNHGRLKSLGRSRRFQEGASHEKTHLLTARLPYHNGLKVFLECVAFVLP